MKLALAAFLLLGSLNLLSQPSAEGIEYSVILIGDAGELRPYSLPILEVATERLAPFGDQSAVIFLGDNIYPLGLPPEDDPKRQQHRLTIVNQRASLQGSGR